LILFCLVTRSLQGPRHAASCSALADRADLPVGDLPTIFFQPYPPVNPQASHSLLYASLLYEIESVNQLAFEETGTIPLSLFRPHRNQSNLSSIEIMKVVKKIDYYLMSDDEGQVLQTTVHFLTSHGRLAL
jgi:hypothetical protein